MEINLCMGCMRPKTHPGLCPFCGFDEAAYELSPHHLPLYTILNGKYLVGKVLGEGGFGITYLGWDINLELMVAIKEYYPNGFVTRESCGYDNTVTVLSGYRAEYFAKGLEKFVDEARRLAKFWGLPGIVAVKDYFPENKTAYIVMEFVEGKTLMAMLRENGGSLPAGQVFQMMEPVMESLETVHEAGLIHRDISPDNIMVDAKGRVKLLDFGAARSFISDSEKSLSVMLKPGYAPEEQYRSRGKQGPWTDVYSLCATMYRAITGGVPLESLDRMAEDTLKRPSELGFEIDRHQEAVLMKGMAIFQKDRYETMKELRAALFSAPATNTDLTDSYSAQVSVYDVQAPKNSENLSERENITWNNSAAVQTSPTRKNVWDELYGNNMEAAEIEKNSNRKSSLKSKAVESIKNSLAQKYESLTGFSTEDIRENIGYTSVEPASSGNTNIWDAAYGSKEAIRGNLIPKLKSEPQKGTQLRKAAEELREESKGKNIWDEIYGKRG